MFTMIVGTQKMKLIACAARNSTRSTGNVANCSGMMTIVAPLARQRKSSSV